MFRVLISLALVLAGSVALAQDNAGPYQEGVHYHRIETPATYKTIDGVRVTEVFSYLCNHCATFEPYVQNWKTRKPENVELTRIPVEFGRAIWGLYARAYITADLLGVAEQGHVDMMDALWKEQRQMRSMEELADFYASYGVEPEKFLATAKSFAVDMRLRNEQKLVREAGVSGTPSMLVNGKYRVSAGGPVNSFDTMLAIVDALVAKEQAEETLKDTAAASSEERQLASE